MADSIPHIVTTSGASSAAPDGSIPIALYGAGEPITQAPAQANSVAADVPALVADFNALLAKLRTAGVLNTAA